MQKKQAKRKPDFTEPSAGAKRRLSFPSPEKAAASALETFPGGSRFLLAVSGGADSSAMLAALAPLGRERGFIFRVFHVEHGLRPAGESVGDAEAVKELAGRFGIPWRICHIKPGRIARAAKKWGSGIEAAARKFRHRAWNRERRRTGAVRVLVAHTADDLLENVLMAFLRGAGSGGLAAMAQDTGRLLRPLLAVRRQEIAAWLLARNIPFRSDSSNSDVSFFRNRVRLLLVPLLDREFPGWRNGLPRLAETQRLAADFIASEAARRFPWKKVPGPVREGGLFLDRERFFAAPLPVREEALFRGAAVLARLLAGERHADPDVPPGREAKRGGRLRRETLRRFAAGEAKSLDLGPLRAEIREGRVILGAPRRGGETGFSRLIGAPGNYRLQGLEIEVSAAGGVAGGGPPAGGGVEDPHSGAGARGGAPPSRAGFFAELPLVIRPLFPGEGGKGLGVFDRRGAAAFITPDGGLREPPARNPPGESADTVIVRISRKKP